MTVFHVTKPDDFGMEDESVVTDLVLFMLGNEIYIALPDVGVHYLKDS
jgi:hypothetical protein